MEQKQKKDQVLILLSGRIDSDTAQGVEDSIAEKLAGNETAAVVLDAADLEYISSAGLRVLLRLRKKHPDLSIINVSSEIYEVFEITGFSELMDVQRVYRSISLDGCEVIGQGSNGTIYRIDKDHVVKIYNNADALEGIRLERENARLALILGIPTEISYEIVKVGGTYGAVFELLNARSFAQLLAEDPDKADWCIFEYVKLLKKIHATVVPEDKLPDMKDTVLSWAEFIQDYLPPETGGKLIRMIQDIPYDNHMIHGDYHLKNLELQNGEVLLIDMDTLSTGNPIFELAFMYNAFIGFAETDPGIVEEFQGIDYDLSVKFWHKVLAGYLETTNETKISEVEDKARIIGYTRLIRREIRRGGLASEEGKRKISHWKEELTSLIDRTDMLTFSAIKKMKVVALQQNLHAVLEFIEKILDEAECPLAIKMRITLAAEETFINIASYAYPEDSPGPVELSVGITDEPRSIVLTFEDQGKPYNPLAKDDPDVTLSVDKRRIGGLGIFLTKKTMDNVSYEYRDGRNILKLTKLI